MSRLRSQVLVRLLEFGGFKPRAGACVAEHLQTQPYTHYEAADSPGLLIRITADGKRAVGRFVNRRFQTVKATRK